MAAKESKHRQWVLVCNNYTEEHYNALKECSIKRKYLVIGKEKGSKKGVPHLQAYVWWNAGKTRSDMKRLLPGWWFEPAKGNALQNQKYCTKDGDYYEEGTPPAQGRRTDLLIVAEAVDDGTGMYEISREHPETYIKYHRGIEKYKALKYQDRNPNFPPKVVWMWGAAGVGKTAEAVRYNESYYIKDGTQWWDGYEQQKVIIIDDFDGKWPYRDFLRLLDRYPYQGQYKGGYIKINSPVIIITCEYPPRHFWQMNALEQVTRRIKSTIHLGSEVSEVAGNIVPPPELRYDFESSMQ